MWIYVFMYIIYASLYYPFHVAYICWGEEEGGPRNGFPYKSLKVNREIENQRKPKKPRYDW